MTIRETQTTRSRRTVTDRVDLAENIPSDLFQARQDLMRTAQLAVAGELVGAITHDLRQPITALQVNLELAIEMLRKTPPDVTNALSVLEDAASNEILLRDSVRVLQDLVSRRQPSLAAVPLADVLSDVVRLLHTETIARQVVLDVTSAPRLAPIAADPTMFREAVLSLVLDAVENSERDSGQARVKVSASASAEAQLELTVSHTRKPGVTVHDAWALAVARSVAEAHGATMLVDVNSLSGVVVRTTWPTLQEATKYQD